LTCTRSKKASSTRTDEHAGIYDPNDRASVEAVMLQQRGQICFGPLCVSLRYQPPASVEIEATLLGVKIASCDLNLSKPDCTIGGSIDGFTAQAGLALQTDPFALRIDARGCAPIVGCKSWSTTIPLAAAEEAPSLDGHQAPAGRPGVIAAPGNW
jgi:hypothetical protein